MEKKLIDPNKIAVIHSDNDKSLETFQELRKLFTPVPPEEANVILVIGGDGELLHALHKYMHLKIPLYGINAGSIGFLMNVFRVDNFLENLQKATPTSLHPLEMHCKDVKGVTHRALAINEVSIFRKTNQLAKFAVEVDGIVRIKELCADGALVAAPAGSSAYNLSAGGHIVPLDSNILSLTPICPFRPRRWNGALLSSKAVIKFIVHEYNKRPVNAVADFREFPNITQVTVHSAPGRGIKLLFDERHTFEDRVIKEQFSF